MHPTPNPATDAALTQVIATLDATALLKSCLYDLAAVFDAIKQLTRHDSTAHTLAGIGQQLAEEWGDLHASQRAALEQEMAILCTSQGAST